MSDIRVRLGGDNSEFRAMMGDSVKQAGEFSGKLVDSTVKKFGGLTAATTAIAVALGLNIRNISEQLARFITGMSEEQETAYGRLDQLVEEHTRLVLQAGRARLSDEQKYQLALQERATLEAQIAYGANSSALAQEALEKKKVASVKLLIEIEAYERKMKAEGHKADEQAWAAQEKAMASRISASEKDFQATLKTLGLNEQIAMLKESIATKEKLIASGVMNKAVAEEQSALLSERKNQLLEAETKAIEIAADAADKKAKNEIELAKQINQLRFDALTIDEQIAELEGKRIVLQKNVFDLSNKGITVSEDHLALMQLQQKLDVLRGIKSKEELAAQQAILDIIEQQNESLKRQVSIRTVHGRSDQDLSDRELAEKIQNLKSGISANQLSDPFGKYDYLNNQSRLDLERAEAEQQLRRSFRTSFAQKGEAALLNYSAFDEQRLRKLIRPEDEARAQRTLESLDHIRTMLQRSGIFSAPTP